MAVIEERRQPNGKITYRVKIRIKGQSPVSRTFRRKTDATRWATEKEAELYRRRNFSTLEGEHRTLGEAIDRFLERELPAKPKVARLMRPQLLWWKKHLGDTTLIHIQSDTIRQTWDLLRDLPQCSARPRSNATLNRYLVALSIVFSTAERDWGWIRENPVRRVRKLKELPGRNRFLSKGETARLLGACRDSANRWLYPVVVLALTTGARKSELLTLRWRHVDLTRRVVSFEETKNGHPRTVPLSPRTVAMLAELAPEEAQPDGLLFPSQRRPDQPIAIQAAWETALEGAGITDFRFHDLRHTAASNLAMQGQSQLVIAEVLGHRTLEMVKRYAHLSKDHIAAVVSQLDCVLDVSNAPAADASTTNQQLAGHAPAGVQEDNMT